MSPYEECIEIARALDDWDLELAVMGTEILLTEHAVSARVNELQIPIQRKELIVQQRAFNSELERRNSH